MAFWKQLALALILGLAGIIGWGALDPAARPRLMAAGVPEVLLPQWAFLAPADSAAAATPKAEGARRGETGGNRGTGGGAGGARVALVVTAPVVMSETADRVSAIGTAEAARTVAVFPRATGMVTEIGFTPGAKVEAGAALVRLDDDSEKIALEQAKAALQDADARASRNERLAETRAISAAELDTARFELSKARLALQEAELNLSRRVIAAPFAGIVGLTSVEVGDMVSTSTEIVTLDDRSAIKVEFRVPEAFAARVAIGQPIEVATPSQPGALFEGKVTAVGSRIEADSRTLVTQATVDNPDDRLRPGMSFAVTLRFPGVEKTAVPAPSVQWDRDGSYVWTIDDGKAKRSGVAIIERNADTVLVSGDLKPGDPVVVEGIQSVRADAPVRTAGDPEKLANRVEGTKP
ncbi:efflux transporter periplasmic adaptor subunit [Pleomorphomonas diazotrophica]|uniref:Efflux transporter periplasmic adaptor subunit n=1 Tax=Pleomorphomonas diazotrophica TaxID=1166257 RepID=A0A1I4WN94_9HYPH|nr:efflux RND transporter periplasmic adaptor subunit [Pleomorphomonas diazotrophica]PKR87186.1 efflux transporter periplasmic adaptor subunit [Pleomorphomonas diazotrophica]SFN14937.1 RND family efflux transporter, MFP subunit [Pleomorphomonas diazotrophica]